MLQAYFCFYFCLQLFVEVRMLWMFVAKRNFSLIMYFPKEIHQPTPTHMPDTKEREKQIKIMYTKLEFETN